MNIGRALPAQYKGMEYNPLTLETHYHRNRRLRAKEAQRIRWWMIADLFLFAVMVGIMFYAYGAEAHGVYSTQYYLG